MAGRLVVVAAVVALFVVARLASDRRRRRLAADDAPVPRLPAKLVEGSPTWVVFTTPYCGSCGPLADRLRSADPDAAVVTVDATEEPALAEAYRIRSAPTVLLAAADGTVERRFVGAAAVEAYLKDGSSASRRRGLDRSRSDRIGSETPQSMPMSGSSQATPNSSAGS